MTSGVKVDDAVFDAWVACKGRKCKYVTFMLGEGDKNIVVDKVGKSTGDQAADYASLVAELRTAEESGKCRYAAFDLQVQQDGMTKDKLILIMWGPDTAPTKQKMLYSSSKDALKKKLHEGIGYELQANDYDELDYDDLVATVISKTKW